MLGESLIQGRGDEIDLGDLSKGIYLLQLKNRVVRVVKQ